MLDRGYASRQRKVQLNIQKGRESENDYARSMIAAGLEPFSKSIQQFIDRAWRGKPGPKAIAAVKLSGFPDVDIVAFIAFKAIIDGASQGNTATKIAIQTGHLLEDEMRFSVFEESDKRHFTAVKNHITDTTHPRYRRNMMIGHMNNRGFVFKRWAEQEKLRIGMKLMDLLINTLGMVKLTTKRMGRTSQTYVEFTESINEWMKRQRVNRFASYPIYMPCVEQPIEWLSTTDGGFHTKRLQHIKAIKSRDLSYLQEVSEKKPTAFFQALNCLQNTQWEVNTSVLEIAQSCWDRSIEVGCLIDAETLPLPPKPFDIDTNEDARLK